MDNIRFGHTLRMLRMAAGIGLREMAKQITVSPAYLSQVELGKQPPPTHDRILKIAEIIGIPGQFLFEISTRPNPDVMELLQARPEMNDLIQAACELGFESGDIHRILVRMQELGRKGFLELLSARITGKDFSDRGGPGETVNNVPELSGAGNDFVQFVNKRLIFPNVSIQQKRLFLRFLLEKAGKIYRSFDPDIVYDKLIAREEEYSTGIGKGTAIPHIFVENLKDTVISVARIPQGLDFDAIDRRPVYLVCLLMSHDQYSQTHINLLAFLARRFQHPAFIGEILKARTSEQLVSIISGYGSPNAGSYQQVKKNQ